MSIRIWKHEIAENNFDCLPFHYFTLCGHSEMKTQTLTTSLCVLPSVANTSAGETLPGSISVVVGDDAKVYASIHIDIVSSWLSEPFRIVVTYCIRLPGMVDRQWAFRAIFCVFWYSPFHSIGSRAAGSFFGLTSVLCIYSRHQRKKVFRERKLLNN